MQETWQAFIHKIHTADQTEFWFLVGAGVVVSIIGWFQSFAKIKRARIIEDVPTSQIRSAAQGYVELIGTAQLMEGPKIFSPLTGIECLWYHYTIEEKRRSGRRSHWATIESKTSDALFLLEDETGICIIDPEKAEVTAKDKSTWYGFSRKTAPPKLRGGIMAHLGMGRYRFTEKRLTQYECLYAIGEFKTIGGGENTVSAKTEARELISKWKHDKEMLSKFDTNGNGELEMDEWEALRKAAHQEVFTSRTQQASEPATNVLSKPAQHPYLLSTHDPDTLVRRYRLIGQGLLVLAIILGAVTIFSIKTRLSIS